MVSYKISNQVSKMKRNMPDTIHTCHVCNKKMEKKVFNIHSCKVRGWECPNCKEAVLYTEDAQKVLMLNKLKKGLPVKVGQLGNSLIIRLPAEITEFYHIEKGKNILLKTDSLEKLEIEVND